MYNMIKSMILSGRFTLPEMQRRIKSMSAFGDITPEQRRELEQMALEKADALHETDKGKLLKEHDARIKALEEKVAQLMGETEEPPTDESGDTVIPEYVTGKWYYSGDVVEWQGKAYVCIAPDGVVCVWSPSEYPTYWQEVTA
ncbi:MAG: hypothetical protein J6N18_04770 [Kiritimatiellae bacterium]|nr:hypothetical protein [Kiritimatiellia bacterium]